MKRVLVLVKSVPGDQSAGMNADMTLNREAASASLNLADQSAAEAAFSLGSGFSVVCMTMGPPGAASILQELVSRGADQVLLLSGRGYAGADTQATAYTLTQACKVFGPFDLILCGRHASDGETGQVPPMLASILGWPCISDCVRITENGGSVRAERSLESLSQTVEVKEPCVLSFCEYSCRLRLPCISGMKKAMDLKIPEITPEEIGADRSRIGRKGSLTAVVRAFSPDFRKRHCRKEPDAARAAEKILQEMFTYGKEHGKTV